MDVRAGSFVVVVGPDGVGKSTVARALVDAHPGPAAYFHFVPPLFRRLPSRPPDTAIAPPKATGSNGWQVLGWLRLAHNVLRYWLGYVCRVRPAIRAGALVIGDRGMYGYLVQPDALRFYGPAWLARAAIRALPRPTLIANLRAPGAVVHARKQELALDAIEHELEAWRRLPEPSIATFSATRPPAEIAQAIVSELKSRESSATANELSESEYL